ncbi:MAG: hypothetical protein WCG85_02590 [Polyangia bacterium]
MMGKQQPEVREAAPSAAKPQEVLVARLAQVEPSVAVGVVLVEPLGLVNQAELVELPAALEPLAQVAKAQRAHRFACATQPISR